MFLGQYDYALDPKGRLNFPARFREEMGERFIVTRWLDGCLVAYSTKAFAEMAEKLAAASQVKSREIQRFIFSAAVEVEPDKQGRILLPAFLREYAHLEKEVTIIGNRNHAEIWATEAWAKHQEGFDMAAVEAAMEEIDF